MTCPEDSSVQNFSTTLLRRPMNSEGEVINILLRTEHLIVIYSQYLEQPHISVFTIFIAKGSIYALCCLLFVMHGFPPVVQTSYPIRDWVVTA